MYNDWFRPGGSIISCIGSKRKESLLNCCTLPVEGDTLEDISNTNYSLMKCAAYRQGIGVDLSILRPNGAKVGNAAKHSMGVVPWGKKFSSIGNYVGQLARNPAILISLSVSHPDIEEFIQSKIKTGEIENANISVQITNDFIDHLKQNKQWELTFDTGKEQISRKVDPSYIMDLITSTANKSAEPGVQYIDLMRSGSMVNAIYETTGDKRYKIISTNACCFTEDTKINTDRGLLSLKEIGKMFHNNIDLNILSFNTETNIVEYKKLELFHERDNGIPQNTIVLKIEKDHGDVIEIECTPDHKFYTKNRGLVKAIDLIDSDELIGDDELKIKSVIAYEEKKPVYNIQVRDNHNYFVDGILVKNSEKPLPPYGTCNLGSINMETFSTDPKQYKKELQYVVPYILRLLDNVIQYELDNNKSPLEQQKYILEHTREVGLGITNLHGWLLKQNLQYDSDDAIDKVEEFYRTYTSEVFKTSMSLGKEKGNAPGFDMVTSEDLYKHSSYFKNIVDYNFGKDPSMVKNLRNMSHISIAPAGSISQSFSKTCISSGMEPIIAPYYWRKTRAMTKGVYEYYFVLSNHVKKYVLSQIDKDTDDYIEINEFSGSERDNNGEIGKIIISII